jgi:hypothetical protein
MQFSDHCGSILTENQADPRKILKHESTCRVREDMAEASPLPPKGIWAGWLVPMILYTKISSMEVESQWDLNEQSSAWPKAKTSGICTWAVAY